MTESQDAEDRWWDFYWEVRLQPLEDLGKREIILAVSKLVRQLAEQPAQSVRLLELGCGEGQIIGALFDAHSQARSINDSCGVDYSRQAIERCRRSYPGMSFLEADFTDRAYMAQLGQFEIVLLVNALHEVYSAAYSAEIGEVDVTAARQRVAHALAIAVERMAPGGYLALFDGLETAGNTHATLHIRFRHWPARRRFNAFVAEYLPFHITFQETGDPSVVEISWRDFTRYITKSIFLEKRLWQTERLESYQYFNETEFREMISHLGLTICQLRTLTVNYEKWRSEVEIVTPGVDFPAEHIMILAQKRS